MVIQPRDAVVFAGSSLRFHATLIGAARTAPLRWTLVGPGFLSADGTYSAPLQPAEAQIIASTEGAAASTSVRAVGPPPPSATLAINTCYDDGNADARDSSLLEKAGTLYVGPKAAGLAVDAGLRVALVAVDAQVAAIDLATMRTQTSAPFRGSRFSEVASLGRGVFAVTDNNAQSGEVGVRIFGVAAGRPPAVIGSARAGETPEGIAALGDGRSFFVTNVNGNSVMRFALDASGNAKLTGKAQTGARPFGVAVDRRHRLLFVADNDTAAINGARSRPGLEVFSLPEMRRLHAPISTGTASSLPLGIAVDESLSLLFVTNEGDGNVAVYSLPGLVRVATLAAGLAPWLPAIDVAHGRLFVPSARSNRVDVFDTARLRRIAEIPTCGYPTAVGIAGARR